MSKYNINKEYGLLRYVKLPFSKFIIFLSSIILTNKTISLLNSKELSIKKVKINTSDNKKIPLYILLTNMLILKSNIYSKFLTVFF